MPTLALSTCWNSPRHIDGYEMMAEIAALGFQNVELSHGIRLSLVPGVVRAVEEKMIRVVSTHNFCPLPPGVNTAAPNLFTPSSADERITLQWERYTLRSLDFAFQVGASLVVSHLGDIEFGWRSPAAPVARLVESGGAFSEARRERLVAAAAACLAKGVARKAEPWERVFENLEVVLPAFQERGILLGAENREKCTELPLDADFGSLLQHFPAGSGLAYWHDVGHAHLKEKMGLLKHEDLLRTKADRLGGFHLHDVRGFHDHQLLGTGEIDFGMVARYVRPEHLLVLELNPRLSPNEIVEAKAFAERVFDLPGS